ncbi:hypothetical protein [Nocardioides sp. NPDC006273]|uniref:hypothetical protein n=1 Tax=Nocardioides sp. NPDC006273 TaxID=3155598 RepID=UPI0033BCEF81
MTRFSPRSTFAVADVRMRTLTFDQLSLFTMLWAGQGLIQLLTYEYFPHDALFDLLLVATLAAIVLPNRTLALATMLVLNLAYSWAHLPYQVNHHLLEDCINLMLLGALAIAWMRRRRGRADVSIRSATYEAFAGPARGALVIVYLWSGIAKANTGFFDPMTVAQPRCSAPPSMPSRTARSIRAAWSRSSRPMTPSLPSSLTPSTR